MPIFIHDFSMTLHVVFGGLGVSCWEEDDCCLSRALSDLNNEISGLFFCLSALCYMFLLLLILLPYCSDLSSDFSMHFSAFSISFPPFPPGFLKLLLPQCFYLEAHFEYAFFPRV